MFLLTGCTKLQQYFFQFIFIVVFISACSTNPLTGKSELSFYSTNQQISIGTKQYSPSQQSQGGQYIIDPALTAYVKSVTAKLVKVIPQIAPEAKNLPYEIVVLNNSVPNAWALPGGKMAINRGLLVHLSDEAELASVIGHEIVHALAAHGASQLSKGNLLNVGSQAVGLATRNSQYGQIAQIGAGVSGQLLLARYGRGDELESDKFGMQIMSAAGYDPYGAVRLQEKFVSLSKGKKTDWISGLFASHPPSQQRVEANKLLAQQLPSGVKNKQVFEKAVSSIKQNSRAYELENKSRQALVNNRPKQALNFIDKAIAIEPKQSHFYILHSDVYAHQQLNQPRKAIKLLDKAIELDGNYFLPWLKRGQLKLDTNQLADADYDFRQSQSLLPTAESILGLGIIAERQNDFSSAKQYYAAVAKGKGNISDEARRKFINLDFEENPHNYVKVAITTDNTGQMYIHLTNQSPYSIKNTEITLRNVTNGFIKTFKWHYLLQSNQQKQLNTGLTYQPNTYQVYLTKTKRN